MPDAKSAIRRELLLKRDALSQDARRGKSGAIARRLLEQPEYRLAGFVLCYVNFRSEVGTRGIIARALMDGKKVILPKVDRKAHRLRLFEITDEADDLEAGYMGIYEPVEGRAREASPGEVDLVVLPGVGFDAEGGRLGYGGGYYDRVIETLRPGVPLVALAFDLQVVGHIPVEGHDKRVDKIITETRLVEARAGLRGH